MVLTSTETIDANRLHYALRAEAAAQGLDLPDIFRVPGTWGKGYVRDARTVPACREYQTVRLAEDLMNVLLGPVLRGEASGKTWDPVSLAWH